MKRVLVWMALLALCLMTPFAAAEEETDVNHARNWYEIFVRSYYDSDGDGVGDLAGVTAKLDYIEDMGYNGIWLMPIMPSPSYHKYDVTDYKAVDPQYGTLEDMRALVAACHERGIALIIDMVLNHSSTEHPWFVAACDALRAGDLENPYVDYYCFTQKAAQKYIPVSGTDYYYEEQFEGGHMPDLNLDSGAVFDEIRDIFTFWLTDVGVDGFRLDAVTSYYAGNTLKNVDCLAKIIAFAKEMKPGCYLVGEAWTGLTEIARYYESGVDSFFLFPAAQAEGYLARVIRARSKPAVSYKGYMEDVRAAIPDGLLAPFIGNHDTGRALVSIQGRSSVAKAKFAQGILNMMGGATFTYYGDEIGMVGSGDDPNKRLAMYWSDGEMTQQPPGTTEIEYAYPSVEAQLNDPDSLLCYCRELNRLKLEHPAIAAGENEFVYGDENVIIMKRVYKDETCYIAINFSAKQEAVVHLSQPDLAIMGQLNPSGNVSGIVADASGASLTLTPYAIVILGKNP